MNFPLFIVRCRAAGKIRMGSPGEFITLVGNDNMTSLDLEGEALVKLQTSLVSERIVSLTKMTTLEESVKSMRAQFPSPCGQNVWQVDAALRGEIIDLSIIINAYQLEADTNIYDFMPISSTPLQLDAHHIVQEYEKIDQAV